MRADKHFLPWHRLFTLYYDDECGHRGSQPDWDWTLDTPASNFVKSPLFDVKLGFGGNGPQIRHNASNNEAPDAPAAAVSKTDLFAV